MAGNSPPANKYKDNQMNIVQECIADSLHKPKFSEVLKCYSALGKHDFLEGKSQGRPRKVTSDSGLKAQVNRKGFLGSGELIIY